MQFRWCYFTVIQLFIWLNQLYFDTITFEWSRLNQIFTTCVLQLIVQHRRFPHSSVWRRDTFQGLTQHLVENHILNGHQLLLCTKSLSTSEQRWIKLSWCFGPGDLLDHNWRASSNEKQETGVKIEEWTDAKKLVKNPWKKEYNLQLIWGIPESFCISSTIPSNDNPMKQASIAA